MNKLCCVLTPKFIYKACDMKVCQPCYEKTTIGTKLDYTGNPNRKYTFIMYHEKDGLCPKGANTWSPDENRIIVYEIYRIGAKRAELK